MALQPKPFWLRWVTAPGTWVTISPTIYHPADQAPEDHMALVAHETVHLWQQAWIGKWLWLWRWFTNRSFRLTVESEGIAAEVLETPQSLREHLMESYADDLAGSMYFHAAKTEQEAYVAILRAVQQRMSSLGAASFGPEE